MELKLQVHMNMYSGPEGKEKLVKRNIPTWYYVDSDSIIAHHEILNTKGNIHKSKCKIFIRDIGGIIVNHSAEYIQKAKETEKQPIGFLKGLKNKV